MAWPTPQFQDSWTALRDVCADVCDKALDMVTRAAHCGVGDRARETGSDFSVCYTFHYPNAEGHAATIAEEDAGEAGINVKVRKWVGPLLVVCLCCGLVGFGLHGHVCAHTPK